MRRVVLLILPLLTTMAPAGAFALEDRADHTQPGPTSRIVDAVSGGVLDIAILRGPQGGSFADRQPVPLTSDISMRFRHEDVDLRRIIDAALSRNRDGVGRVPTAHRVPRAGHPGTP